MLQTDGQVGERTDGRAGGRIDGRSGPTNRPAFAKATQVKIKSREHSSILPGTVTELKGFPFELYIMHFINIQLFPACL